MQGLSGERGVTLRQVWADYQIVRKLKKTTLRNYKQRLTYIKDWLDLPIESLTEELILERHSSLKGDATANGVFRTLRALIRFAQARYKIIPVNPVTHLSEVRAWRKDRRRSRCLRPLQLNLWFRAVYSIESQTTRDFLLVCLLTGCRSGEIASLKWSQVDLQAGVIRLYDTKNGSDVDLPMSDFVWNLMTARHFGANSEYVFPGSQGSDHFRAGSKSYGAVASRCGIRFSPHDLRRTFATVADELELKDGVVKALMNHTSKDITDSYTIRSVERLRRATQSITSLMLQWAGWPNSTSHTAAPLRKHPRP